MMVELYTQIIIAICSILFSNNIAADGFGGAMHSDNNSYIYFEGNSSILFSSNLAILGGAIHSDNNSYIYFEGSISILFSNNVAGIGGAIATLEW